VEKRRPPHLTLGKGRWLRVSEDREIALPGGNVGGAVRIGETVRRRTGPWTPAVHALLGYLAPRVPHVPRVIGFDDQGREVLSYLPGHVADIGTGARTLSVAQVVSVVRWTRAFHDAVAGFSHPGPWRFFPVTRPSLIGHNDIAPYNVCFDGDELVGVFDWDLAGPSTPLLELAFIAWNCVPLWRDIGPGNAAARLEVISATYGAVPPGEILRAVPFRIQTMLDGIPVAAAAGDEGMARLIAAGEPGRSFSTLAGLIDRIPAIGRHLR
jgi:Phosphotransferase enzyme family